MYILKKKKGAQKLNYQNAAKKRTEKIAKKCSKKRTKNPEKIAKKC